jgi:hypothetical protein
MADRAVDDQRRVAEDMLLPHTLGRSFFVRPEVRKKTRDKHYLNNSDFWKDILDPQTAAAERVVTLTGFNVFEWVPRNPGLYHTPRGEAARANARECMIYAPDADERQKFSRQGQYFDHAGPGATVALIHPLDRILERALQSGVKSCI